MEVEDDVFYADLSRRIALLIMDDDDNTKDRPVCFPSMSLQVNELPWTNGYMGNGEFQSLSHPMMVNSPLAYEPATCRRECKGTGVFIPRSSTPSKKNKPGRFASFNANNSYRQPERSRVAHLNSNLDLSCNYSNTSNSVRERLE